MNTSLKAHAIAYALVAFAVATLIAAAQVLGETLQSGGVPIPAAYPWLLPLAGAALVGVTAGLRQLLGTLQTPQLPPTVSADAETLGKLLADAAVAAMNAYLAGQATAATAAVAAAATSVPATPQPERAPPPPAAPPTPLVLPAATGGVLTSAGANVTGAAPPT